MKTIVLIIIAYLLGSIPSGFWIGKAFYKKDIRQFGSGNTGTTNTFRVLGVKAGFAVFLADLLKGTLATSLAYLPNIEVNPLWFGLCAILGHVFPIFAKFKGGKAVATSAGMLLGYHPLFFFYSLAIFLILLYITSMVSLSSMIAAVIITLSTFILPFILPALLPEQDWLLSCIAVIVTVFIFYLHRQNIQRLRQGTESRISFGLNKKPKEK
ncbi:glycerol-3-phosphate 1-O-acyltransferase PlsY [Tetragenococcus koreensis]|uniref:Glycerol-3-phosphate acyltransferase n=1 Tax=Tetragenococcus koreensis TaxID=290335 RepID=A0AAN4UB93_9ENTE|nr:glycerol-3-phosphate 1-O-acyltransferase PlsY [Tetragenococcus koreensis]AYW45186.1 glycerol-3-phosphate acyltransferase [Tetragenococcus koreensis]MCF1585491.1 glycerol-3-phosphate 1-O-acyltransferase PlsY [Tetragenococcus koreensis]MCF1615017.1 glycerol-3-phosphate 1-O-acyltransferase PlsY [Tetragenococcus koreensis]MCF1617287.1 glycerol-3-phosphate 1-O-acyltransferase PlsY [Tetragenococcus koreensis]MCF1620201.1 glycerol-3-phosphate 1-O-acyltransferase PlsY [Tetragenococcus koreensis]